jgi:hypothetical protein
MTLNRKARDARTFLALIDATCYYEESRSPRIIVRATGSNIYSAAPCVNHILCKTNYVSALIIENLDKMLTPD